MRDSQLLIYENQEGHIKIDAWLRDEPVWLSQEQMVQLFYNLEGLL